MTKRLLQLLNLNNATPAANDGNIPVILGESISGNSLNNGNYNRLVFESSHTRIEFITNPNGSIQILSRQCLENGPALNGILTNIQPGVCVEVGDLIISRRHNAPSLYEIREGNRSYIVVNNSRLGFSLIELEAPAA